MIPPPPKSTLFPYTTLFRSIPNTADIGLDKAGVELAAHGFVRVNERLETSVPDVWAIGECRSEEHTSELQSLTNLVCRLLLEKKKNIHNARPLNTIQ